MADLQFDATWSPDRGVVELRRDGLGPAGARVIIDGHLRVVLDAASDEVRRIVIDLDAWAESDRGIDGDLHDPLLGPGLVDQVLNGSPEVAVPVTVPGRETLVHRLAQLAVALDARPESPRDRAALAVETAALALGVAGALPGLAALATDRLWSVLADPDTASEMADADPGVARALRPYVLWCRNDLERRGTDGPLVVALDDLLARWAGDGDIDGDIDPRRGPGLDPHRPTADSSGWPSQSAPAAAGMTPAPPAAPAITARAGAGRARARPSDDPADDFAGSFDGEFAAPVSVDLTDAAGAPALEGPEALIDRSGDEVYLSVPHTADPDDWVRVAARTNRVLLAASPVRAAHDGLMRLPVAAAIPDHELLVDVVADPSLPVRDRRGDSMRLAVKLGQEAVAHERRFDLAAAHQCWLECQAAWAEAGEDERAQEARMRAYTAQHRSALLHERLPSAS